MFPGKGAGAQRPFRNIRLLWRFQTVATLLAESSGSVPATSARFCFKRMEFLFFIEVGVVLVVVLVLLVLISVFSLFLVVIPIILFLEILILLVVVILVIVLNIFRLFPLRDRSRWSPLSSRSHHVTVNSRCLQCFTSDTMSSAIPLFSLAARNTLAITSLG